MNYDFSLDKKTIGLLAAGSALVGILVFVAGLIIGVHWNASPSETTTVATTARQHTLASDETEQPTLPKEALLGEEGLKPEAGAPAETVRPQKPIDVLPPLAESGRETQKGAPLVGADPKVIQRAEPDVMEDAGSDEGPAYKRAALSVQVGVFLEEIDADRLVEELESKGYTPTVFVANDADNRPWYAVRIGAYTDQAEAAQAASNFTKQEKLKATVRPIGSL